MVERMKLDFQPELVDREEEFSELKEGFKKAREGEGSTVFVAGEAGIGKTKLVIELLNFAEDEAAEIISCRCLRDSLQSLMPIREGLREAGLSYLVSHRPPPKVLSAYLINDAGILVAKAERGDTDIDSDIFSSMLASVQNFVKDSLSMMGRKEKGELNTIGYGDYNILIQSMEGVSLAAVIEGTRSELLIDDMREKLSEKAERAKDWMGDTSTVGDIEVELEWFINSGKYDGKYLVDEPELKKENLFENVLLGFQRLANEKTVVLFLDDLQWAGPSTLSLLHYLARNTTDENMLILGTYRPEDLAESKGGETHQLVPPKREMKREGLLEEIELERLTEKDVEEFIQELLGETDFEKDFLERIYKESEGNPFFLLELTKILVEEGHVQQREEDGVWKLVEPLDEIHIPEKVYEMVKRRLEKLIEEQRGLLEYASVVGEEFEDDIVAEATDLDRVKVLKNLNDIEKTYGLIRSLGKKYQFDHSMIREVLYNGMNESLRKMYHQVIAESYETLYEGSIEKVVENVAHHYYKAGDERAGKYLLKAARRAEERYANEEGERFYEQAVEISERKELLRGAYEGLGDLHRLIGEYDRALEEYDQVLDMLADENIGKQAEVLGKKAKVYEKKGEFDESLKCCERGLELVEQGGEEAEKRKLKLLGAKGWAFFSKGESDYAEEAWIEAVEVAEKIGDEKEVAQALHDRGNLYWGQGRYNKALKLWKKALSTREDIGDKRGIAASLHNIGEVYRHKGELDRALEHFKDSLEIERKIGNKRGIAISLNNLAIIYKNKGELDQALEHYQKSLEIKKKIGDKKGIGTSLNNLATVYKNKGELDRALEHYQKSLEIERNIGDKKGIAESLHNLAIVYKNKGELDRALEHCKKGLQIRKDIGDRKGFAKSINNLGILYDAKGKLDQALKCHEESLEIDRKIGDKQGMAISLNNLGTTHRWKGEIEIARKKHEKSLEICSDIGDRRLTILSNLELSEICIAEGRHDQALQNTEKALEMSAEMGAKQEEGRSRLVLGKVYREKGELEKAEEELEGAKEIFEESGQALELPKVKYEYALLFERKGEHEKAEEYLSQALEAFEDRGMELWRKKCEEALDDIESG